MTEHSAKFRLGKLVSKHIIVEVLAFAGPRKKVGELLVAASRMHRSLLQAENSLMFMTITKRVIKEELPKILGLKLETDQIDFIDGLFPYANKISLLFRGGRDGWQPRDFHRQADHKGRTLTIFESSKGYLAAAYSSIAWSSEGDDREDKDAFVCSLTNEMRVFRPEDPSKAVFHHSRAGPCFDNALSVIFTLNDEWGGACTVKGSGADRAKYCVETDTQGNSVLTGGGGNNECGQFTCTGLEVFLIE